MVGRHSVEPRNESKRDSTVVSIRKRAVAAGDWTRTERGKPPGSMESRPTDVTLIQWVACDSSGSMEDLAP